MAAISVVVAEALLSVLVVGGMFRMNASGYLHSRNNEPLGIVSAAWAGCVALVGPGTVRERERAASAKRPLVRRLPWVLAA